FGTLAPAFRASDKPMAIACLRLLTFLPDRPLFKVPRFLSCIALLTLLAAFFPYLAMDDSFTPITGLEAHRPESSAQCSTRDEIEKQCTSISIRFRPALDHQALVDVAKNSLRLQSAGNSSFCETGGTQGSPGCIGSEGCTLEGDKSWNALRA